MESVAHVTPLGLTAGAIVFLAGAIGVEIYSAGIRYQAIQERQAELAMTESSEHTQDEYSGKRNYAYVFGTAAEELLEMLGVAI